ncbi:MAG: hypothetical protein OEU25_12870 [Rhodospirillales bacterium]|nr:hypothetical protein [Rhodospirillales bacterium]
MADDRSEAERLADEEKRAHKEAHRAHQVSQILDSGAFKDAVEAVKQQLYEEFARSPLDDDGLRLRARIGMDVLDRILKNLRHHIDTGKLAQASLLAIEKKRRQKAA